jgi:hypothetical protein
MTTFGLPAWAVALALAGCSAAAAPQSDASFASQSRSVSQARAQGLSCDVTAQPTRHGVLIEGRAYADHDVYGEYDLVITKSGGAGSSDISQGGEAAIAAGSSETLGQAELSVEPGARLSARLVVRDERGELCRRTFRL